MEPVTPAPRCPNADALEGGRPDLDLAEPAPRRLAVAGKGGTGKTTISGTLAREIAARGRTVWAIDADSTPNLGLTLGIDRDELDAIEPLPRGLLQQTTDEEGKRKLFLPISPGEVVERYGTAAPDGIRLLLMGRIDHAGAG